MRLAFVSLMGGSQWGGSEALWHAVALHALQQRDDVFVSVYDWGSIHPKIKELQQAGAKVKFRKRYNPVAGTIEKIERFFKQINPSINGDYQSIIDFKPSFVFLSQGDSFDLAIHHRPLYYLFRQNNIPYSFVCHSHVQYGFIPPKEIYPQAKEIFKNARNVFFVSERQWKLTERRLITKLHNANFTWNPLSFDVPSKALAWPNSDTIQMALVGNVYDMKGQDTVLEVLSGEVWRNRQWQLNIYGEGAGIGYLKDLSSFYDIADRITFHGYVQNIYEAWVINHILLIPSAGEGLPISLVEAMACARPSIVTDVGGNKELITKYTTGFIADSPTVESFSLAMENAWLNKTEWEQIGVQSFTKIRSVFASDVETKIYELLK